MQQSYMKNIIKLMYEIKKEIGKNQMNKKTNAK